MTISTETFRVSYTSTGGTIYPYTFRILETTDLKVYVNGTLKTESTDYTVTGAGNPSGGNVVFVSAPTAGSTVLIVRDGITMTQETDYIENDSFPADSTEDALDKLTMLLQKVWDYTRRSVKLAITSNLTDLELPSPEASKLLAWNSLGTALTNVSLSTTTLAVGGAGQSLVLAANASEVYTDLGVSPFARTILDDLTSTAAFTTMGVSSLMRPLLCTESTATVRNTISTGLARFSAFCSATYQSLVKSAYTKLTVDTERFDAGGCYDSVTNYRFTAPRTGYYHFDAGLAFITASTNLAVAICPYKNGALYSAQYCERGSSVSATNGRTWSDTLYLTAGQYMEIYAYSPDAAASVMGHATGIYTFFSGYEIGA